MLFNRGETIRVHVSIFSDTSSVCVNLFLALMPTISNQCGI